MTKHFQHSAAQDSAHNAKNMTLSLPKLVSLLAMMSFLVGLALPALADSSEELLEKAIYTEQTVGDLDAAIEIYSQILEDAAADRPYLAQARFRLAMCYAKTGQDTEAAEALDRLIRDFPEEEKIVARAREELTNLRPALALSASPWEDGEFLKYRMSLPTGKEIGFVTLAAHETSVDGVDAWQLEMRRFVGNNADNYGVSRILVDRHTMRPINSSIRHGVLGSADASWNSDGVTIQSKENVHVDDVDLYDNDETMFLLRMLPLAPGYETRLRLLPIWTGTPAEASIEVTDQETCRVPAGEFECVRTELDLGSPATYWFSTGAKRYPIKLQEGIFLELVEIGKIDPDAPVALDVENFGFSGSLPSGWMAKTFGGDKASRVAVRLLDPEATAVSSIEIDRCPGQCPPLQKTADRELAGAKQRFDGYKLREESKIERMIDDRPAISFIGDYLNEGKPWVQYRIYTMTEELRVEIIFRVAADRFDDLRSDMESILDHLEAAR